MSSAVFDGLLTGDPEAMTVAELADALLELDVLRSRLEVASARVLSAFDAQQGWGLDGAVNPTQWITARCDRRAGEAGRDVRLARRLREFALTATAADLLGASKVRVMLGAVNQRTRDAYARDEVLLLGWAEKLTVEGVVELMREWTLRVDQDGPAPHAAKRDELTITPTLDGRWHVHGDLTAELGAAWKADLDARAEKIWRAQRNCPELPALSRAERNGEALHAQLRDATRRSIDHDDDAARPAFTAIVDLDTIEGRPGSRCEIPGFGPIHGDTARRLLCDCHVNRLITDAASMILDAGRSTRTINRAQRRALVARDGGCGWPGCDMPHTWCDAHHLIFWGTQDGPSDLDNLRLLCRRHHRLVHEGGWSIERTDRGEVIIHTPNGTRLEPPVRSMDRHRPDWEHWRQREPIPV